MRFGPVLVLLALVAPVANAADHAAKTPRLDVNGDPLPDGAIARLGTSRFQPPASPFVRAIALSPDGKTVATATHDDKEGTRIDFMDTSTGKSLRKLKLADIDADQI